MSQNGSSGYVQLISCIQFLVVVYVHFEKNRSANTPNYRHHLPQVFLELLEFRLPRDLDDRALRDLVLF